MKKIVMKAPAKLNLALAVTGLTTGGYHLVDMIMQSVSLYERVEIVKSSGYSLTLPQSPVPANSKNTATKAAKLFFTETGLLAGADITIYKKVPTRAGMAGGSADAAAVLMGLNQLYGARLTLPQLCKMGAQIGADVPFSILGGTARASGIGDILQPLPPPPPCWFTVAMPKGGVSTPIAYAKYDEIGSPVQPNIAAIQTAIQQGNLANIAANMQNALEHANGGERTLQIRKQLDNAGALASMMTGSGAAVFGLFANKPTAEAAAKQVEKLAPQVFVVQPVAHGPIVEKFI
ncbi:4-(cytidine 5'-diphospho)-2-C-methyl-D-erythritol kinase [Ruminococcaceae bacterium OttesenSCG-928-A16]|nr:4-(cytidine 5'-diphospho)-2-C-methyl-D-erythritol kinase [Ruminococcaceae bacterium OttesenSCG-928-A16]